VPYFWLPPGVAGPRSLSTTDRLGRAVEVETRQGYPFLVDEFGAEAIRPFGIFEERDVAGVPWVTNELRNPTAGLTTTGYSGYLLTSTPNVGFSADEPNTYYSGSVQIDFNNNTATPYGPESFACAWGGMAADLSARISRQCYVSVWFKILSAPQNMSISLYLRGLQLNGAYLFNQQAMTPKTATIGVWYYLGGYVTLPGNASLGMGGIMVGASNLNPGQTMSVCLTGATLIVDPPAGFTSDNNLHTAPPAGMTVAGSLPNCDWEGASHASRSIRKQ
jgi:hypothetical protein